MENLLCGINPPLDRQTYEQLVIPGTPSDRGAQCQFRSSCRMLAIAKALKVETLKLYRTQSSRTQKIFEKI
jgi:hypothetical protein